MSIREMGNTGGYGKREGLNLAKRNGKEEEDIENDLKLATVSVHENSSSGKHLFCQSP